MKTSNNFFSFVLISFFAAALYVSPAFTQTIEPLIFKTRIGFDDAKERIVGQKFYDGETRLVLVGIKSIQVWDVITGKLLESRPHDIPNLDKFDTSIVISPDGQKAVVFDNFTLRIIRKEKKVAATIWDLRTGKQIGVLERPTESVRYAEWSANGRTLMSLSGFYNDKRTEVSFWDGEDFRFKSSVVLPGSLRQRRLFRSGERVLTVNEKSEEIVFGIRNTETSISIRNNENAKVEQSLIHRADRLLIQFDALSPDEKFFVAGTSDKLLVWEIGASDLPKYEIAAKKKNGQIWFQNFSDDGRLLIARQDKNLEFYEAETGALEVSLPNVPKYESVKLLGDGETLVLKNCDRADVFDLPSRRKLYELKLVCKETTDLAGTFPRDFDRLSFHPNAKLLLTYSDKTVRVWNAENGAPAQTLVDPLRAENKRKDNNKDDGLGWSAGWLDGGKYLFASGADGKTILLWELKK